VRGVAPDVERSDVATHCLQNCPSPRLHSIIQHVKCRALLPFLHCDDDDDHNASLGFYFLCLNSNLSHPHFSPHSPPRLNLKSLLHHHRHHLSLGFYWDFELAASRSSSHPLPPFTSPCISSYLQISRDLFLYRATRVVK
jgi:hypothetical protein